MTDVGGCENGGTSSGEQEIKFEFGKVETWKVAILEKFYEQNWTLYEFMVVNIKSSAIRTVFTQSE